MDNNYFDLQGGGPIIDPEFCDERCALRNLFGLAFFLRRDGKGLLSGSSRGPHFLVHTYVTVPR